MKNHRNAAQHLITKPVFDALFAGYSFASNNPVSKGMQNILDLLNEHRLDKEADTLEQFYESVRRKSGRDRQSEGKQKIVVELYDKFFRNAFPKMTERLGIVYTPVEVVDFIIHSVNDHLTRRVRSFARHERSAHPRSVCRYRHVHHEIDAKWTDLLRAIATQVQARDFTQRNCIARLLHCCHQHRSSVPQHSE